MIHRLYQAALTALLMVLLFSCLMIWQGYIAMEQLSKFTSFAIQHTDIELTCTLNTMSYRAQIYYWRQLPTDPVKPTTFYTVSSVCLLYSLLNVVKALIIMVCGSFLISSVFNLLLDWGRILYITVCPASPRLPLHTASVSTIKSTIKSSQLPQLPKLGHGYKALFPHD